MAVIKVRVGIQQNQYNPSQYDVLVYRDDQLREGKRLLYFPNEPTYPTAKNLIKNVIEERYEVLSVHDLRPGEELIEAVYPKEKIDTRSMFQPKNVHFAIPVKAFEKEIKRWLKEEKGLEVCLDISYEGPDDYGRLGDFYFYFDKINTDTDMYEQAMELYGDGNNDYVLFELVLQDYFEVEKIDYDFNIDTSELYVYIPFKSYLKKIKFIK